MDPRRGSGLTFGPAPYRKDPGSYPLPGGFIKADRDPSFQIHNPPYLEWGISQPTISSVTGTTSTALPAGTFDTAHYGDPLTINTPQASNIDSVTLVRFTAITHEVDGDQRTVNLAITGCTGNQVSVNVPTSDDVVPPGPYMLFVNQKTAKGDIPSVAKQIFVGAQTAAVPAAVPSKGLTSTDYQGVNNDTPNQVAGLANYLGGVLTGSSSAPGLPSLGAFDPKSELSGILGGN